MASFEKYNPRLPGNIRVLESVCYGATPPGLRGQ
jgi:hypothetical protein